MSSYPNVVFSNLKYSTTEYVLVCDPSTLQDNKKDVAQSSSKNKDHIGTDGSFTPVLNSSKEDNKQNSIEKMELDHCEQCRSVQILLVANHINCLRAKRLSIKVAGRQLILASFLFSLGETKETWMAYI